MSGDKFSAVWVSHSSISDYLKCPRAYYLNNVYRDPKSNHKICIMQPPLALGQSVHEVLESLSVLPTTERFNTPLPTRLEEAWKKVSGKMGGFLDPMTERRYKQRALDMLARVRKNPGPILRKAVKIKMDLPHYWLSEEENIILCGKIDWLEYIEEKDAVKIIDFKTGKNEENGDSLQLPIYRLLVDNCQRREVLGAGYWYIDKDDTINEVELPSLEEAYERVLSVAKKIKLSRQLNTFTCPKGSDGCFACQPLEKIVNGEAELVGTSEYNQDVYILNSTPDSDDSVIL